MILKKRIKATHFDSGEAYLAMMCFLDFVEIFKDHVLRFTKKTWNLLILNVSYPSFIRWRALVVAIYASVKSNSTSTRPTVQS